MPHKDNPHLMAATALFAAAITVMTAYMLHIPIPTGGYIHLGDALIYLAACLLPTLVIKAALPLFFTSGRERILCRRNIAAVVLAGLFSPAAYALAGCAMAGTMAAFAPQFLGTLVQGVGSGALFLVIAPALDGAKLKERLWA